MLQLILQGKIDGQVNGKGCTGRMWIDNIKDRRNIKKKNQQLYSLQLAETDGVCHDGHQCLEEPDKTHEEEEKEPVNYQCIAK